MSLIKGLRDKPSRLTVASKYTALNGVGYLVVGAILIVWPGVTQTLFREPAFAGHEQALMRVIGLTALSSDGCTSLVVALERDNSSPLQSSTD